MNHLLRSKSLRRGVARLVILFCMLVMPTNVRAGWSHSAHENLIEEAVRILPYFEYLMCKHYRPHLVGPESLVHLTDLPSSGDTAYSGVVRRGTALLVGYYTGSISRDPHGSWAC